MGYRAISIPEGAIKQIAVGGTVIWRKPSPYTDVDYVFFDGSGSFELPIILTGADTTRIGFAVYAQGNLCGWYTGSSSGTTQYSVYTSATSSYVRYNGQLKRNWRVTPRVDYDLLITPNGYSDGRGYSDTFTKSTFTGGNAMLGGLPNSTSAFAKFKCYYFKVDGKIDLKPVKRNSDGKIGLLDSMTGDFYTGNFLKETAPVSLAMGRPQDPDEDNDP